MVHYTYKITQPSTKFYYIGVRSCKVDPLKDPYMGSMKSWKLTKEEKALCTKEIIAQYDTREEANEDEHFIIKSIKRDWKDVNCKNGHDGKSFCSLGIKLSEETKLKIKNTDTYFRDDNHKELMSKSLKGKNKGKSFLANNFGKPKEDTLDKISKALKGRKYFTNGSTNIFIFPGNEPIGFVLGRIKNKNKK